jgi:hypothetical protein
MVALCYRPVMLGAIVTLVGLSIEQGRLHSKLRLKSPASYTTVFFKWCSCLRCAPPPHLPLSSFPFIPALKAFKVSDENNFMI